MEIVVASDVFKQANYICFIAKDITRGLFQDNGYVVLPYFTNHAKAVYFPDLNYSKKFWVEIKKTKHVNLSDPYPKYCIDEVLSKLNISSKISINLNYHKLVEKYKKYLKGVNEINILETEFGTVGSYFINKEKIYMTQRIGNTNRNFKETLILATMKHKNKDVGELGSLNWHKRTAVAEYFLGKSNNFLPLKYKIDSKNYLQKLGLNTKTDISKINTNNFTVQEKSVFNTLLCHHGEFVSFDVLANILWKERVDEKFSLEAIAKVVENLRKKIINQGINKEIILTKRGFGYYLQN